MAWLPDMLVFSNDIWAERVFLYTHHEIVRVPGARDCDNCSTTTNGMLVAVDLVNDCMALVCVANRLQECRI